MRTALIDASKLWLAHDGLWFQEFEKRHGMEEAIEADTEAWRTFTVLEARRIMARLGIAPGGGMDALAQCLAHRLYSNINEQKIERSEDGLKIRLTMTACRVQEARRRKGLPDFPCKSVGKVEYAEFAKAIDPRIKTRCDFCPPDATPDNAFCRWEFSIE
ncbi:MAG: hypothetical protein HRF49_06065 [bacterium]